MKAKNVQAVCRKKFKHFLSSVKGENAKKQLAENTIITGGAIASMLLGEEVNDFDFYFRNRTACLMIAQHFVNQFCKNPPARFRNDSDKTVQVTVDDSCSDRISIKVQSAGVASETPADEYDYFEQTDPEQADAAEYVERALNVAKDATSEEKPKYRPVFLSSNAITLSDRVQLVTRFYGEPGDIHENYDFVHCTNYWTSWDEKLYLQPGAVEALLARDLRYVGSKYPLCSLIRARKFVQRGWTCNAGQYLKMAMQLNELDLTDVSVLEEQLTGVDTAYFIQVIDALKKRNDKVVDTAYLVELIDKIF